MAAAILWGVMLLKTPNTVANVQVLLFLDNKSDKNKILFVF